ncbi:MAG: DNA-processing protein DprA [Candidatus Paceibacterota bacterium]
MHKINQLTKDEFPELLKEIPDQPKTLYLQGNLPSYEENKFLCVVGSRKYSNYGKEVCEKLISGLRGYPIVIVSGLALGIDGIAHRAALDAGLKTVAVPGSGLNPNVLYPSTHRGLAQKILENDGALLTEFEPNFHATVWSFPQRNRIMAGLSHAILIIEAELKSGTLITSRLATDYNRDVLTVPGSIFSKNSEGPNMLMRLGATPITSSKELLEALGFNEEATATKNYSDCSELEIKVLKLLEVPISRDELLRTLEIPVSEANALISILEIKGFIKESAGEIHLV